MVSSLIGFQILVFSPLCIFISSYHIFYLVTEVGVVTLELSGSYIPCFSVYVESLSEITQYSEVFGRPTSNGIFQELPYYKNEDDCCRSCAETWVWADPEKYENVDYGKSLEIACSSLVKPFRVSWFKKSGDEWEPLLGKSLKLTIHDVSAEDAGNLS